MIETPENEGEDVIWKLKKGDSPLIATAVHDGHQSARRSFRAIFPCSMTPDDMREEDPFTGRWVASPRIIGRFAFAL